MLEGDLLPRLVFREDALLIVYALLFGILAMSVMSLTSAIFESHRRRVAIKSAKGEREAV